MTAALSLLTLLLAAGPLGVGAWRCAAACGADGALRIVAAAPLAAAAAELSLLGLGRVGLSDSRAAVVGLAALMGGAAIIWLPRGAPAFPRRLPRRERLALGAAAGLGVAWTVWVLRFPGLGVDPLYYHLTEAVLWAQHGDAGAAHQVMYTFPVEAYPLNDEMLVSWLLSASRWLGTAGLWAPAMMALAATAAVSGLRRAGVSILVCALAVAAILALPAWTRMAIGPHNDLGAFAWMLCAVVLAAASRERPELLVPALVAGGLSLGTKTTTLPLLLAALVLFVRRPLPRRAPLAAALLVGGVLGGVWYVRNLFVHGSPLWPFVAAPWGDPIPPLYADAGVSFLSTAGRALASDRLGTYWDAVAAGPALLLGVLVAPLLVRTRRVRIAVVVALLAALAWTLAPFTGRPSDPAVDYPFGTIRYAVPAFAAAVLALALAAADARPAARRAITAGLAAIVVVSAAKALALGFPYVPPVATLLGGAAIGWAAARLRPRWVPAACALVLALVFVRVTDHFAARHSQNQTLGTSPALGYIAGQPGYEASDTPVFGSPESYSALAGDRLNHPLTFLPAGVDCARVARLRGWFVLGHRPGVKFFPADKAYTCLAGSRPAFDVNDYAVFDRRR